MGSEWLQPKQFPKDFKKKYDGSPTVKSTVRKQAKTFKTPGNENLLQLVEVPKELLDECAEIVEKKHPEMEREEMMNLGKSNATSQWLAGNTVDFYNEVALLYRIVEDYHQRAADRREHAQLKEEFKDYKLNFPNFSNGFPQGFEYRIKSMKKDEKLNGAEYVNLSMIWIEDQIDDPDIFPKDANDLFPAKFVEKYVSEMFKRMFRIFAIIYSVCWPAIIESNTETQANACFKHLYFFMQRFNLLKNPRERDAFMKTNARLIMDLEQLDQEYSICEKRLKRISF